MTKLGTGSSYLWPEDDHRASTLVEYAASLVRLRVCVLAVYLFLAAEDSDQYTRTIMIDWRRTPAFFNNTSATRQVTLHV